MIIDTAVGSFNRFRALPERLNNKSITLAVVDVNMAPDQSIVGRYRSLARGTGM